MRMSVITKEAQIGVDPHEEVKKLQDLVKKLELQNQQLRCRQRTPPTRDRISPGKNEGRTNDSRTNKTQHSFNKNTEKSDKPKRREGSFKEGDFIILDELDLSDEESWLYSSPKGLTPEDRVISPYKWMRKDLEDPENKELQLARRALANKLDELALLTPSQQNGPVNRSPSNSYSSGIKSPFGRRIVDSRTFTRNRRKKEGEVNLPPGAIPVIEPLQYSYHGKSENSVAAEDDSLADVIDVHEIARLQEESLKQYSPASTPKRNSVSSLSGRRSGSPLSSTSDIDGQDYQAQHPISPCAAQSVNHNNELHETHPNTTAVHSRISNHSSPTNSRYGSNNSLDNPTENVRRSLPNLARGSSGIRLGRGKNISESELQRPSRVILPYQRIESRLTPPSQVGQIRRQSSPGSRQSPRQQSPLQNTPNQKLLVRQQSPFETVGNTTPSPRNTPPSVGTPKSGLPRPSKIPASKSTKPRSGIPVPYSDRSGLQEDQAGNDWSEGCF